MIDRAVVLRFMREHRLAGETSITPSGAPQAAVVGFVVSDSFELFFDTIDSTRKAVNLRANPQSAFVSETNAFQLAACDVHLHSVASEFTHTRTLALGPFPTRISA